MSRRRASVPGDRGPTLPTLAAVANALAGVTRGMTLYATLGFSTGAAVASVYVARGIDPTMGFAIGFFTAIGPVYLIYASGWGMRRTRAQIKEWERHGLIDNARAEKLRDKALDWFIARRF